ncbi:hypothetical protein [Methylorubrum podarium]|uniref:hypothetical protein n=1 Tax=Methylorubrum podarium TaxID=200476 RepID=UPI001EE3847C|nr:hypothetical protein [Methylorubrum podarium]GJE71717.1 hypothetical protein CHKEEEPN_3264 [Methylorubrum podarium]
MTIVACWLDESYGVTSLAALADARASEKVGSSWVPLSDNTIKLFAVEVRCFKGDSLAPGFGAWVNPYYKTTIGLGFAGHCFEALTIIAHIQRAMAALVVLDGPPCEPTGKGLVNLAMDIARRYLNSHKHGSSRDFELLIYGWDGPDDPWIGKIVWDKRNKEIEARHTNPNRYSVITIGDGAKASGKFGWYSRIRTKIARQLYLRSSESYSERGEFSQAVLAIEATKQIERGIGYLVESKFVDTVGGVRQRLQIKWEVDKGIAAFTADNQPALMDGLPSVRTDMVLAPIPVTSGMEK